MEAAAVVGVAAAALQFLDFGSRLLSTSYQVYKSPSGQSAREASLSTITDDLSTLLQQLRETSSTAHSEIVTSPAQRQLLKLSEECETLLDPLRPALAQLEKDGHTDFTFDAWGKRKTKNALKTIQSTLKAVLKDSETQKTTDQLESMRRRIMSATLSALWEDTKLNTERQVQFSHRLDEILGILLPQNGQAQTSGLDEQLQRLTVASQEKSPTTPQMLLKVLNDHSIPETKRIHDELVKHLWDPKTRPDEPDCTGWAMDAEAMIKTQATFRTLITQSLEFEKIRVRQEAISKAHERTFLWIFEPENAQAPGNAPAPSSLLTFPEWLKSNTQELYWITGKPGSGKSTLMSYIVHHHDLQRHLAKWGQDMPVYVLSYYAWIAGMNLQKSCEGFMRTMIHHILELSPEIARTIAPRRWALLNTLRSARAEMPPWELWEVEESFEALLCCCGKDFKLGLFIDGLDEFNLPPVEIIDLIKTINARDGIKLCVASRQWTEFDDAFKKNPMLRMQDLTAGDIIHYVQSKLGESPGFMDLQRVLPTQAAEIIDEVVRKSSGVFLWVSLVVKALLVAVTEGDGLEELRATIDRLPNDIANLYDAILGSISQRNIHKSAEILTLYKRAHGQLSHRNLWLADEPQQLSAEVHAPMTPEAWMGVKDIMKRRLDSRTRGILEIEGRTGDIQFLHRTALDWASRDEVWEHISSWIKNPFEPHFLLLKAEAVRVRIDTDYLQQLMRSGSEEHMKRCFAYASSVRDEAANRPELCRVLDAYRHDLGRPDYFQSPARTYSSRHITPDYPETPVLVEELACMFGVLPYLREKMSSGSGKSLKAKLPKLLTCAVFGYPGVHEPFRDTVSMPEWNSLDVSLERRLEMITHLIERGANPTQDLANRVKFVWREWGAEAEPDVKVYWGKVMKLIKLGRRAQVKGVTRRLLGGH